MVILSWCWGSLLYKGGGSYLFRLLSWLCCPGVGVVYYIKGVAVKCLDCCHGNVDLVLG